MKIMSEQSLENNNNNNSILKYPSNSNNSSSNLVVHDLLNLGNNTVSKT